MTVRLKAAVSVALGLALVALGVLLIKAITAGAPLFAQSRDVPSVNVAAPASQWAAAAGRARPMVQAAIVEQNLPGISVAVGVGGVIVWAEGFGWRDVGTETPVTPATRFNIGSAASAVTAAVAPLGLVNTGAETAVAWSPEQIGEPGEDFPLFTMARHLIFQPLGLAPAEYPLPGDRATFYVPRSADHDPRRGRRLMYMRDLACCDGKAFYSTPSDLVRVAMATNAGNVNGELAGGRVMSLITRRDRGIAVAVASNIAYAHTDALAAQVAEAFSAQK